MVTVINEIPYTSKNKNTLSYLQRKSVFDPKKISRIVRPGNHILLKNYILLRK